MLLFLLVRAYTKQYHFNKQPTRVHVSVCDATALLAYDVTVSNSATTEFSLPTELRFMQGSNKTIMTASKKASIFAEHVMVSSLTTKLGTP